MYIKFVVSVFFKWLLQNIYVKITEKPIIHFFFNSMIHCFLISWIFFPLLVSSHPVIFSVHGSAGDKLQFSGIKFPQVSIDTPPNYNVATGVYTVPEDGYYTLRITDGILRSLKNLSPFMVDGHRQTGCYGLDRTNNAFSVCQIYVYLRAGQRVWTQDSLEFIHTNTTVFSGWKM